MESNLDNMGENKSLSSVRMTASTPNTGTKRTCSVILVDIGPKISACGSYNMHSGKTKNNAHCTFWLISVQFKWILNLEFCLQKLLIFYQKILWNMRSRLNSSTFWVFRPVFRYVCSKMKLFVQRMKILIKHI